MPDLSLENKLQQRRELLARLCVCGHEHGPDGECSFEPTTTFPNGCTWCPGFTPQLDSVMEAMLNA